MNHRRLIRARSETARLRLQQRRSNVRTRAGRRKTTLELASGRTRARRVRESYLSLIPSDSRPADRHGPAAPPWYRRHRRAPGRRLGRRRTGRDVLLREKCTPSADVDGRDPCNARTPREWRCATSRRAPVRRRMTMNLSVRSFEFRRFTPERFHVLLNSLFKVLFNFPSRYLFAIGLAVIFSLRWSLPPT